MFKKTLSLTVIFCFFLTTLGPLPKAHADSVLGLPAPGTMVNLSPAYEPTLIKGLIVHKDNPFLFDFIVDTGNSGIAGDGLKKEGDRLVKYFFACLTIPEKDLWVNLSPYEKDRMVPQALGQTALGRDLLAQDYILKQLTASLIYPEKDLGKSFWDRVYAKAQQMYGTTQIPVNTFNKVWIVADKASVYEHGQTVFVVSGHMKVMLEEDYLALTKHQSQPNNPTHSVASQIVKQIVLPEIEKEVNAGKNFATLRQIFNSLILASWYKKNLKEALLTQVYANKSTVKGVNLADLSMKQQIYQQYLKAYKKGVFNYIKEDAQPDGQTIPRKYFSGGFDAALVVTVDPEPKHVPGSTGDVVDISVAPKVNNDINPVASPATTTPTTAMAASQSGYGKISEMYPVRGSIIGKTFDIFHGEGSAAAKSRLLVTDVQEKAISGIDQKTSEEITIYSNEFLHAQEVPDAAMAVLKKGAQKKVFGLLQNFEGLFGQISVSDQPMLNIKRVPVSKMIDVYKDMRGILSQVRSLLKENAAEKEGAGLIRQMQKRLDTLESRIKDAGGKVDAAMTAGKKLSDEEIVIRLQDALSRGNKIRVFYGMYVAKNGSSRFEESSLEGTVSAKGLDIQRGVVLLKDDMNKEYSINMINITNVEDAAMAAGLYGNYEDMRIKAANESASRRDIKFIVTFTDNGLEKKALVSGSNVGDVWADGLAIDEKRGLITTPVRFLPNQFIRAQVVSDVAMTVEEQLAFKEMANQLDARGMQRWIDGVTYEDIVSGKFREMVESGRFNGVTTNPPLIKGYLNSLLFNPDKSENKEGRAKLQKWLGEAKEEGLTGEALTDKLMDQVVANLAKEAIGIMKEVLGQDTKVYFSVELNPNKSEEIAESVAEAEKWAKLVPTDSLMVKVLATEAATQENGIIEQVLNKGIQVNATGIMYPEQYAKVADAYGRSGKKVASVASVFVSRWLAVAMNLVTQRVKAGDIEPGEVANAIIKYGQLPNAVWITAYHDIFLKYFGAEIPHDPYADFSNIHKKMKGVQDFLVASNGNKMTEKSVRDLWGKLFGENHKDALEDSVKRVLAAFQGDVHFSPLLGPFVLPTTPQATLFDVAKKGVSNESLLGRSTILDENAYLRAKDLIAEVEKLGVNITEEGAKLYNAGQQNFRDDFNATRATISQFISDNDEAMSSKPLSYGDRIEIKKNQTLYFRFNSYGAFDVQFHDDGVVTVNDANARPGTSPGRVYSGKVFEFLKEGRHLANIYFEGNRLYVKNLSSEQFLYTAQTSAATVAKDAAMAADYDWRNRAAAEQQQIREHIVAREAIERIERRGTGVSSSEAAQVLAYREAGQKAVADEPSYMWRAKTDAEQRVIGAQIRLKEVQSREARHGKGDKAATAQVNIPGGIDLNTSNGMQWKVSKDGNGVEMNIDPAMIARIRREGIDSLSPVILRMTPIASIWSLMGLQAPVK